MLPPLRQSFVSAAELDLIKFKFDTTERDFINAVFHQVLDAAKTAQGLHPAHKMKPPKFTLLGPARDRPDGAYIVQLFGLACRAVYHLPSSWLQYVTFADVKCWTDNPRLAELEQLRSEMQGASARRTVTYTVGGTGGTTTKGRGVPTLRVGSRLSDFHYVLYRRTGMPICLEGRFRGERLLDATLSVLDHFAELDVDDTHVWRVFTTELSSRAAKLIAGDMSRRGVRFENYTSSFFSYGEATQLTLIEEAPPPLRPEPFGYDPDTGEAL
jgi:hypothetical protein